MHMTEKINVLIMGAAGRDFHNFNAYFRDNPFFDVKAFTATQIPNVDNRTYPKELAGRHYPKGIPIFPEQQLASLIKKFKIDYVYFAYSDISHEDVMHKASLVLACGANFALLGPKDTQLKAKKPVISVTAVRTGAGKSPTSRKIAKLLKEKGYCVVVVRHPMPYGDLKKQRVQRFKTFKDLDKYECTIEEREEYEPHLMNGIIVYAGVDYGAILKKAEQEADVIIFDGGNNDFEFFIPDLKIVIADPHRAGHEVTYHPGETNFRTADIIIIPKKTETVPEKGIALIREHAKAINSTAKIFDATFELIVDNPQLIAGKRALVVEDGPTLTHGGMTFGAAFNAAHKYGASSIIDAQKYAVGSIKDIYVHYPHLKKILPSMGYGRQQIKELEATINAADCDVVIDGTPVNLSKLLTIKKPIINVDYEIELVGKTKLFDIVEEFEKKHLG